MHCNDRLQVRCHRGGRLVTVLDVPLSETTAFDLLSTGTVANTYAATTPADGTVEPVTQLGDR